jgi:hypothetical protein
MNHTSSLLKILLVTIAGMQLGISILNLFLVPLLKWKDDLARAPLLLREVFQVHAWFISITLAIFAVMTFRFADDFLAGTNLLSRWLAVAIGSFWLIRTILQVTYYSGSHWRGQLQRTAVHILLLFIYGGFAAVYLWSGFRE